MPHLPIAKVFSVLSQSQQGRKKPSFIIQRWAGAAPPECALRFGRQKRDSFFSFPPPSTAAPFVLQISFPISSFTCRSEVCLLMTLLPSGSSYFPKDINLPGFIACIIAEVPPSLEEKYAFKAANSLAGSNFPGLRGCRAGTAPHGFHLAALLGDGGETAPFHFSTRNLSDPHPPLVHFVAA